MQSNNFAGKIFFLRIFTDNCIDTLEAIKNNNHNYNNSCKKKFRIISGTLWSCRSFVLIPNKKLCDLQNTPKSVEEKKKEKTKLLRRIINHDGNTCFHMLKETQGKVIFTLAPIGSRENSVLFSLVSNFSIGVVKEYPRDFHSFTREVTFTRVQHSWEPFNF